LRSWRSWRSHASAALINYPIGVPALPIPAPHTTRHVYHFTHFDNLEAVLTYGFLSCSEQTRRGLTHRSIALDTIQSRRSRMPVTCGAGGVVHDYVPLYFCKLSPMLLQIVSAKNVDQETLIHFAFPISILERADVAFTSAAANSKVPPAFFDDPSGLGNLDWAAIDSLKWSSGGDTQKRARMAEVLVHRELSPREAAYVLVWNESSKKRVLTACEKVGVTPPRIEFNGYDGYHWFTNFRPGLPADMLRQSIAPGPIQTRMRWKKVVDSIVAGAASPSPGLKTLRELLQALQTTGLAILSETRELVGLESENEVHKEDVGNHTLSVVHELALSKEFHALDPAARQIVELAAYLHDIGKGPKSRWAACGHKQQVDPFHPIRSAEMLPRILLHEIVKPDPDTIHTLCMLICYHDLIGDIVGRGRKREQILDVIRNARELDMLIALGRADASAVTTVWSGSLAAELPNIRNWALANLDPARAAAPVGDEPDEDE
jgi:hypothetical protein